MTTANPFNTDDPRTVQFMRLFTTHQRQIYCYIRTLVTNVADVDEVWQETNLVLWRKFDQYTPNTNFRAWAYRIAHFEVLNHRARQRHTAPQFSDHFLDQLSAEVEQQSDQLDARVTALRVCVGKLADRDRDLLQRRYAPGASGDTVADALGRSRHAVYKAVGRIRRALLACIGKRLGEEETA